MSWRRRNQDCEPTPVCEPYDQDAGREAFDRFVQALNQLQENLMANITDSVANAVTVGDEVVAYVQSLLQTISDLQNDTTADSAAATLDTETAKLQALLPVAPPVDGPAPVATDPIPVDPNAPVAS